MKLHDIRLSTRITVITLLVVAVGAAAFLRFQRAHYRTVYIDRENINLEMSLKAENLRLIHAVDSLREDAVFLSSLPSVYEVMRAMLNRRYEARNGTTRMQWEDRLGTVYSSFSASHPDYYLIRYIALADGGRELVRVENHGSRITVAPHDQPVAGNALENFRARPGLQQGKIELSDFELNGDTGDITRPTLRAIAPIFGPSGRQFGLLIVNMDVSHLLESAALGLPSGTQAYIANRDGQYLLHPDSQRVFRFGPARNDIVADFPFIRTLFNPDSAEYLSLRDFAGQEGKYAAASRIHFDAVHPERFLLLMYRIPDDVAASRITPVPGAGIAAGVTLMLLASWLALIALRRALSPLDRVAEAAGKIAAGDQDAPLPKVAGGEIGRLTNALDSAFAELRQREELLRESENRYRLLVESSPFCIHEIDLNGRIVSMNRAGLNMLGLDDEAKVRGKPYLGAVSSKDVDRVGALLRDASANGTPSYFEFAGAGDGTRHFKSCFIPIKGANGEVIKLMGLTEDISEHKQFEEMRAKMAQSGRFNIAGETAAILTHELSQPLTACGNYLDVCLRRIDERNSGKDKLREALQLAHTQIVRAGEIINRFKKQVRKPEPGFAPLDVNLLASDVVDFLAGEIKRYGISMHLDLAPLPQIVATREEIRQVLLSLCENAIEAMHSTEQRELRVKTSVAETGRVMVAVSDSGKGLTPAGMNSLFEPFQTSQEGRLGLSLSICRSIVEKHGGRIWAEALREHGAEFKFTLPIRAHYD